VKKIRIGVVGPGLIWKQAHEPALDLWKDRVEIAAFCASSEKTRREVEEAYPGAPFFSSYDELVASPAIDWVLVLTPIALNAPVALAAMRAGKHVFLEKPMARSLAQAKQLIDLAHETGRRLHVLEQAVYSPSIELIEKVMRSGEIGEVVMYDHVMHLVFDATPKHSARGSAATTWRMQADFPLGVLFDGGHHSIARLGRLFGQPTALYASGRQIRPTYGEYDHVLMQFEHENGVRGSFSHGSYLSRGHNYFHIRGTEGILTVERERLIVEPNDGEPRTIEFERGNSYQAMWHAILDAIAEGHEPSYTVERARGDLGTLFAIRRSAQEKRSVSIERDD